MDKDKKVYAMLGLANKAGRLKSGEFMTEQSVKEGKAFLVIVAQDASDNTKKHFKDMCDYRHVPILFWGNKEEIGHAIGKEFRASIVVVDEGFASSILEKVNLREVVK